MRELLSRPDPDPSLRNLVEVLRSRCARDPDTLVYRFLAEGETESERLSVADLDARARCLAARLQEQGLAGERALVLCPPGLDFAVAFFGCLYAEVVAVPAYPPRGRRRNPRLVSLAGDAKPRAVLTTRAMAPRVEPVEEWFGGPWSGHVLAVDDIDPGDAGAWREASPEPSATAFLQYTSGSTSEPKGVMVSHGNLLHNQRLIHHSFAMTPRSRVVSWLPMYHDMGLIGALLQPLFAGGTAILMPPVAFLQRPERWLRAISDYQADTSGGPDFAYELCSRKIAGETLAELDLSSWRVAFNGAEPVRSDTLDRFAARFAPCGFRREAFLPCYGLAESTLLVSGRASGAAPRALHVASTELEKGAVRVASPAEARARKLVSCGPVPEGLRVLAVDPRTREPSPEGAVGEIWVAGDSVALGYWGQSRTTAATFAARLAGGEGPFLRTGDLGFLDAGELFVTGRRKDLVIVRGRNHYPQDLEATAERSHPALRPGGSAAFSVEITGEEGLVLVCELQRRADAPPEAVADAVRAAVALDHELRVADLLLVRAGGAPKTTSGKIRRSACRRDYLAGNLPVVARSGLGEPSGASAEPVAADPGSTGEWVEAIRSEAARVLDIPPFRIEPDRPLLAAGIDSLAMMELAQRCEERFGRALAVESVLAGATPRDLAAELAAEPPDSAVPISLTPSDGGPRRGPLSWGQRALWFLYRQAPESAAYHLTAAAHTVAALDPTALAEAFQRLVLRHESLRTIFVDVDGEPEQRVLAAPSVDFEVVDAAGWSEETLGRRVSQAAFQPFDLAAAPPLRARLFARPGGAATLVLAVHHIVADLWSLAIVARELGALYAREVAAEGEGAGAPLELPTGSYLDYVARERSRLAGGGEAPGWSYWQGVLGGDLPTLTLPTDRPRRGARDAHGGHESTRLPAGALAESVRLARREGLTPFALLLAVYHLLLHKLGGGDQVIIGTPVADRRSAAHRSLVGYLINPVALRVDLSHDPTFAELLAEVQRVVVGAFRHADIPFALLVERLQPVRDAHRTPIFETLFTLQSAPASAPPGLAAWAADAQGCELDLGGFRLRGARIEGGSSRFDLSLTLAERDEELAAAAEYAPELFDRSSIRRLLGAYGALLAAAVAAPERRVSALSLLDPAQTSQVVREWNDTARRAGERGGVHRLVAASARRTPDAVAVSAEGGAVSFAELWRRARRFAQALRAAGIGRGARIGVCLHASERLPEALLGVLEAGAAYVPLDPDFPAERLAMMVEEGDLAALLVGDDEVAGLPPASAGPPRVRLPSLPATAPRPTGRAGDEPVCEVGPDDCAYVIFTSGSTGRPKGVMVPHGAVGNFLASMADRPGIRRGDRVAALTTLSFDIAVLELFLPLSAGAALTVIPRRIGRDGEQLAERLARDRVTLAQATPATWKLLLASGWQGDGALTVLSGGEALSGELARELAARSRRLWNLYGPTETTVWSTVHAPGAAPGAVVAIGRPIANTRAMVLDRRMRAVPPAVAGELYLGGAGVTRGYLGRPGLTAAHFLPDPFAPAPGLRLYRTGDRARLRADGVIEYLGRADAQLKIRGHRIEPGEIEAALRRHPGVRDVAVVAISEADGERSLAAFVVAAKDDPPPVAELRRHLAEIVPQYMVPARFHALGALPLTPNGKLDRRRLPLAALAAGEPAVELAGAARREPWQEIVAGIWADALGRREVGAHDDFFQLGGHSLAAARVAARVRQVAGVELPISRLFDAPTLAGLLAYVEAERGADPERGELPLAPVASAGPLPLSLAQERLWAFERLRAGNPAYLMPAAITFTGELALPVLAAALSDVVRRHETLRSSCSTSAGEPSLVIHPPPPPSLPVVDLAGLGEARGREESARLEGGEARRPFDLESGPLVRWTLVRRDARRSRLLLTAHHLVADAGSLAIFFAELVEAYTVRREGAKALAAPLPVRYGDYAAWQRRSLAAGRLAADVAYWRGEMAGAAPLVLPSDRPRPASPRFAGGTVTLALAEDTAAAVRELCRRRSVTPFMTVLAAFVAYLARYSGQSDLAVGIPISTRDRAELDAVIGLFVHTGLVRVEATAGLAFAELLTRVREKTLAAHDHRRVPAGHALPEAEQGAGGPVDHPFRVTLAEEAELRPLILPGLRLEPRKMGNRTAKFDLGLFFTLAGDRFVLSLEHDEDLFDRESAAAMLERLAALLAHAAAEPAAELGDLPVLTDAERRRIVDEARARPAAGAERRVDEMVFAQAARRPEAIAVQAEGAHVSYGELARRARALATALAGHGVLPDERVGVLLPRSPELVVSQLAVLAAGAAYVAIDPGLPASRIARMLRIAGVRFLVTDRAVAPVETEGAVALISPAAHGGAPPPARPAPLVTVSGGAAYAIFTSGSTGEPKGVLVGHAGLSNLVAWHHRAYQPGSASRGSHLAGLGFDATVWELWPYLTAGAAVSLAPAGASALPEAVLAWLARHRVTHCFLPTPLAEAVLELPLPRPLALRLVLTGGDRLRKRPARGAPFTLLNHYGPTEGSVVSTAGVVAPAAAGGPRPLPAIGQSIDGVRALVLDRGLRPVPQGGEGELYIGGVSLAFGYLADPAGTAGAFVPDPFGAAGSRLYGTGDRVRQRRDGAFEFRGRSDAQVQIRGFRIELGEVEGVLSAHPRVSQAAVVVRQSETANGSAYLVAFVVAVADGGTGPDEDALRAHVARELPPYMVPAVFVALDRLPVNASGKLDREALAQRARESSAADFVAPRTELEEVLAEIWQDLLGVPRVGVHDDFFRLGGHSLQVARMLARVRDEMGVELSPRAVLERPTLAGFSVMVVQAMLAQSGQDAAALLAEVEAG